MNRNGELNLTQLLYNKELNGDWKRQNLYKPTRKQVAHLALYEWVNDDGFNASVGSDYGRHNFRNVFNANPIPTLICEGRWDLTWTKEKAEVFHKNHPNAQLVMFENSGHGVYSDEPELFFSTLKQFVTSLKPASENDIKTWKQQADELINPQLELFAREDSFFKLIDKEGIDKGIKYYEKQKNLGVELFTEHSMDYLGYKYLRKQDYDSAIKAYMMNVEEYPDSYNAYNSVANAHMRSGNIEKAKEYYTKALSIKPDLASAIAAMEELNNENS
jgi:pentatricopeptide repeat protein